MPRAALILGFLAGTALIAGVPPLAAIDSHLDPDVVPGGCATCHQGHGVSRSPMLPAPQSEVCLSCHDSRAALDLRVGEGDLSTGAVARLLGPALTLPFQHPFSPQAFSSREPGAVTCTSCHSPHRGMAERESSSEPLGRPKLSPRDPAQYEFELCQSCHGSAGLGTQSPLDLSRLSNPSNRSHHAVEAPATDRSPSIRPELEGGEINCTDCHDNSESNGPRGPHGSAVEHILRFEYTTTDGAEESLDAYALCYACHDRDRVLDESPFPLHRLHVVDKRAACATCHSAHGSIDNRALIRFGEETFLAGVAPSLSDGRLAFVSEMSGSGSCLLTCHGVDHAPASYGGFDEMPQVPTAFELPGSLPGSGGDRRVLPSGRRRTPVFKPPVD